MFFSHKKTIEFFYVLIKLFKLLFFEQIKSKNVSISYVKDCTKHLVFEWTRSFKVRARQIQRILPEDVLRMKFAKALEIDEQIVCTVSTISSAFKCKKPLNLDKLEKFAISTNDLHFYYQPWARINPSLHKILIHGCKIARKFPCL